VIKRIESTVRHVGIKLTRRPQHWGGKKWRLEIDLWSWEAMWEWGVGP
jgi:hypothetical protein